MNPAWQWWALKLGGSPMEMNEGTPHAGFYRWPRKAQYGARKTFLPVAYWPGDNGKLNCRIGDQDVSPERGEEIWPSVGNHPVTEQAYRAVAQDGASWPDEHELVDMRGHNRAPEEHTFATLQEDIDNLSREAKERLDGPAIADQDEADRLSNLADALAELHKIADDRRKAEKKPHDDAAVAIQKKWAPLLLRAETYKNIKYKLLTPWQLAQEKALKEEAEAAAAAGQPAAAETRRPRAGTRGRAMTLKSIKRAEITDYAETLKFFSESPDVKALVQDLANRAVRSGVTVPGTKVITEKQTV